MKPFLELSDKDIFPESILTGDISKNTIHRVAVKVIISDKENRIALVGRLGWLLPGGGVEQNESLIQAATRECIEEAGCIIEIQKELGFTRDFRERRGWQDTHFFTARIIGEKGEPQTIQENEQGMRVGWFTLEQAIEILDREIKELPLEAYNALFNAHAQLAALKKLKI